MRTTHLGPPFEPLPFVVSDPARWQELATRLHRGIFLRSEGTVVTVGAPHHAHVDSIASWQDVTRRFDRFYGHVAAAYFDHPELRHEFLVNPMFDPLLELERERTDGRSVTPLARFDCVLGADGSTRVIELNPVGVTLTHLRSLLYLIRGLSRAGLDEPARQVDTLARAVVEGFARGFRAIRPELPARPVVGAVSPHGWFRATHRLFRALFDRCGWDYAFGDPGAVRIDDHGVHVQGRRVDLLWPDFLFYLAYQETRYSQTKFPSAVADYSSTPSQVAAMIEDRRFLEHLRSGRVTMLSPAAAYLALPKSLLSWIHDDDRPVPAADRAFLAEHVARTYSARERERGIVTREQVLDEPARFLLKPCQYGGSHGVMLGITAPRETWIKTVATMWDDATWVVQDYWPPARTSDGAHVSLGLQSFGGELGGVFVRTSPGPLVSARDSGFIPVLVA